MTTRIQSHRLQVAANLYHFVEQEALPGTGVDAAAFWQGFDALVDTLAPKNRALLAERDRLQTELDAWHRAHPGPVADMPAYHAFVQRCLTAEANVRNVRTFFSVHRAKFETRIDPRG